MGLGLGLGLGLGSGYRVRVRVIRLGSGCTYGAPALARLVLVRPGAADCLLGTALARVVAGGGFLVGVGSGLELEFG